MLDHLTHTLAPARTNSRFFKASRWLGLAGMAAVLLISTQVGTGQISITNSSAVTQNFNGIGSTTTASLPANWKMTAAGAGTSAGWSTGTNISATTQAASTGSPTGGGAYNWGNGTTTSDRAVGFMTSGSYASPNAVLAHFKNNTGATISALAIAFDIERYRINTAAANVTFWTSTDGSSWTARTAGDSGAFSTGTSAYDFSSGTIVQKSFSLTELNLPNDGNFYLRWVFGTTGSNSQGLGLDNVSVTATTANPPTINTTGSFTAFSTNFGTASSAQSFSVTGSGLTGNLTVTPPSGFEVSLSESSDYASTLTLTPSSGSITATQVFARLSANSSVDTYSGNVTVSGGGASSKTVAIPTSTVSAVAPEKPEITSITPGNGTLTVAFTAPSFTGGAPVTNYSYSLDGGETFTVLSPAATISPILLSGLVNGTEYSVQLKAINSAGAGPASDTVAGTPEAPTSPTVVAVGTLTPFSTTYGTASVAQSFNVQGSALNSNITVSSPSGFEVSTSASTGYTTSVELTQTSGSVGLTSIYVRLAAATAAGSYSGSITVSSADADPQTVAVPSSSVSAKGLTIAGLTGANKSYNKTNTATVDGTPELVGVVGDDSVTLGGTPAFTFSSVNVGTGIAITASGYTLTGDDTANYTLTQPTGLSANITPKELTVTGATVSPKVFNTTTTATITGATLVGVESGDTVTVSGGGTFDDPNVGTDKPVTANLALGGASAGNYTLVQPTGLTGTITQASQTLTFAVLAIKTTADAPFTPAATATSGLAVSFSSSNPAVATVTDNVVTIIGIGTTTITASQAGNENYSAAAAVNRELIVTPPPIYLHDFGSTTITGKPYTVAPVALAENLSTSSWTTSASSFTSFAGFSGQAIALSNSSGTPTFTLSFDVASGYSLNVNGLSFWRLRSPTGAQNLSITINGGTAVYTGTTPDSGANTGPQTITGKTGLTGTVSVVLSMSGASGTGTFRLDDFALYGEITPVPVIAGAATATAFTTTYGTTSADQTFSVSGANLTDDITATAPTGFEVSEDGTTYGSAAIFEATAGSASGTLHVRLKANAAVGGSYNSKNITLTSPEATTVNIATAATGNSVNAKALTIAGLSGVNKAYDGTVAATFTGTPTYQGLANEESFSVTGTPVATFADANVGTGKTVTIAGYTAPSFNYSLTNPTVTANITAASLPNLTFTNGLVTDSGGVSSFTYSYTGRNGTSYSPTSTEPTTAGFYTVTATSADSNYSGSANHDYFIAGPIAGEDSLTKPAENSAITIAVATLLANDSRITSEGNLVTSGLSITGVTAGAGNSVVLGTGTDSGWIFFTPSSASPESFTYTLSDGTISTTGTVTITEEANTPTFTLQLVTKGTASFNGTQTSVTHSFIGVPNQTYQIEFSTNLSTWSSQGAVSTGTTGSFSVTFTSPGNLASSWNSSMFFRAKR
jgi:hypothetical protein